MEKIGVVLLFLILLSGCEAGFSPNAPELEIPDEEVLEEELDPFEGFYLEPVGDATITHAVFDMLTLDDQLVVSGDFRVISSTVFHNISSFDGNQWNSFGLGLDSFILEIIIFKGDLYAGGHFMKSGNNQVLGVARWTGESWEEVGNGVDFGVLSMQVYQGELIVGGDLKFAGIGSQDLPVSHIASWNGERWRRLEEGLNGPVNAMGIYRGELVVAGEFTKAGGEKANSVATWNGHRWAGFRDGVQGSVNDLIVYKDDLIVTGTFSEADGASANNIAKWDGTNWQALEDGIKDPLPHQFDHPKVGRTLAVYDDELWVGGSFSTAGNKPTRNIAIWDGRNWYGTEEGPNDYVEKIFPLENEIYFGGFFIQPEEPIFRGLCKWVRE